MVASTTRDTRSRAFGQKSVLRRILARNLPEELFNHLKQGFNYPVARFLERFSKNAGRT